MRKKLLITSFHNIISRNILSTEVLSILQKNFDIVLLVPAHKTTFFEKTYGKRGVSIEGVSFKRKVGEDFFRLISISLLSVDNLFVRRLKDEKRYGRLLLAYFSHYILGRLPFMKSLLRKIDTFYFSDSSLVTVFDTLRPDMIFATDLYHAHDKEVLREAKKRALPHVGMVRSWDNVRTKGVLLVIPEKIIIHNSILRDELQELYQIPSEKMIVTGMPHYDRYKKPSVSRVEFCNQMGLDSNKKIILFAPGGRILYKDDRRLLALFKRLIAENKFENEVQFLVRMPPGDSFDVGDFETDEAFSFDYPGADVGSRRKENEMTEEDEQHLINTLCHCDLSLTLVSTMVIDSAVTDAPTIILSFDPEGHVDDIGKFSQYSHFKKFLSFGFVKVAHTEKEFVAWSNEYFKNPGLDREKRIRLVNLYCNTLDGKSSQRVAKAVIDSQS